MTALLKDLRQAARMLLHMKSWTAVVLISLGLGIGANTALFTAVSGLLLQSVPVPEPEALVRLRWAGQNDMVRNSSDYGFTLQDGGRNTRTTFSYATYEQLRAANQTLTDMFASAPTGSFNVIVNGQADLASALFTSGNYFRVLRVPALLGRTFTDADDTPGAPPVAVISHAYWRRRFASDPAIVNRVVTMNNQQVPIVGVTPADFTGIQHLGATARDVTVPLAHDGQFNLGQTRMSQPTNWWLQIMGRLKPGTTLEQVRGNLEGPFHQAARGGMASYMSSLTETQRGLSTNQRDGSAVPDLLVSSGARGVYDLDTTSARSASFLGVVVVIVLLIVCANVANLLLSRATTREREISIRMSMGATRGRLVRQLLTESLLLSVLGGALGVLVGYWSRQLLPFGQNVPIDWRVFAFGAGVSLLTGVIFGLLPALRATRVDLAGAMKESGRSVTGTRTALSKALLVLQVAMSLVLLIGAGLFLRTLQNLRTVDIGFNPSHVLMFNVNPALNRYDADRSALLLTQIQERLAAVPGVRQVALTRTMLLSGSTSASSVHVPDPQSGATPAELNIRMMSVSPEFFATMEIPFVAGRAFTPQDSKTAPKVAVINEAAARKMFPTGNAVGRRMGFSPEQSTEYEIVGVIRDTKYSSVRDAAPPTLYQCYLQGQVRSMNFVLRTAGDPAAMTEAVRTAVRAIDPAVPITNVATQTEQVERRFAQERLFARAYTLFGGLALLLACIGLFGLMSYSVSRRTNEIGIRMALGAHRGSVVRMVLGESLLLVGIGIALGIGAALLSGRLIETVLFGLGAMDVLSFTAATALIVAVSTLAGYLPARRASRVDPMVALHRT